MSSDHNAPCLVAVKHLTTPESPEYADWGRTKLPKLEDVVIVDLYRWQAVTSRVAI
jgi:hypothetical protein